jgi:hypothetical protein
MNRAPGFLPPTGTGTALTDRSECRRSKRQDRLSALVTRGADERGDEAVHRVCQEKEPEDRLDLFATQARPAGDWLRDGSRDAPTHPGERRIADSQGSVVNIHMGRVSRMELDETCSLRRRHSLDDALIVSSC